MSTKYNGSMNAEDHVQQDKGITNFANGGYTRCVISQMRLQLAIVI